MVHSKSTIYVVYVECSTDKHTPVYHHIYGQEKSLQTPHTLDIICSSSSPLAGATELQYVHKNHQTQEQFFPPCRHSSEQLTDYYILLLLYYMLYLSIILNCCMHIFQFKYIESN